MFALATENKVDELVSNAQAQKHFTLWTFLILHDFHSLFMNSEWRLRRMKNSEGWMNNIVPFKPISKKFEPFQIQINHNPLFYTSRSYPKFPMCIRPCVFTIDYG